MFTYTIEIPEGTKVLEVANKRIVELKGTVYIDNATRHEDGGFGYCIGKRCYYVSAGCVNFQVNTGGEFVY